MLTFTYKPLFFIFLVSMLFGNTAYAALNGTYTIDGSAAASSTNYRTFTAAVFDLTATTGSRPDGGSRNGPGVSGSVIFKVAAGTFTEQIEITAITGASSAKTITFDGGAGNAASRIITYTASSSSALHTIRVNSASWIHFRNLTIRALGSTYATGVHFQVTAGNCSVRQCIIENAVSSTSYNASGILVSGYGSNGFPGPLEIDSNIFKNGYSGISYYATGSASVATLTVRANTFTDQLAYGLYIRDCERLKCLSNNINIKSSSTVYPRGGIYLSGSVPDSGFHDISGNAITNITTGIEITNSGAANDTMPRCRLTNNMISGFKNTAAYGIYFYYTNSWDIFHNSINLDVAGFTIGFSCAYISYAENADIKNNVFAFTSPTGTGLPLYMYNVTRIKGFDYNNYYKAGIKYSDPLIYHNLFAYTPRDFKGGGGWNQNSINEHPLFISQLDLHTTNSCNNGTALNLATDIDGDVRSSTIPDIGADETTGLSNDAGIAAVLYPSFPLAAGTSDIKVLLKNYGSSTLTSANVHYSINGGSVHTLAWSGSLGSCDTATVAFSGSQQYNFTGGTYNFTAYTTLPNGNTDAVKANDTLKNSNCIALNGNYTINPSGSGSTNFTSFNLAVSALSCGGISGPAIFTVAAGTYTEQVDLHYIRGLSANSTLTFDGGSGNAATRILVFSPTTPTAAYTFRITSTPYVRLRNLTFRNTGNWTYNYGVCVQLKGRSNYCSITNCVLEIAGYGTSSNSTDYIPVLIDNLEDIGGVPYPSPAHDIEIDSNLLIKGYYGIVVNGYLAECANISARGNTFTQPAYSAATFNSVNGVNFSGNMISMRKFSVSYVGISVSNCMCSGTNSHRIDGNKIIDAAQFGINVSNSYNPDTLYRSTMFNNMVGAGFLKQSASGIILNRSSYWDIMHNSVNLDYGTSYYPGHALGISKSAGMKVKNNQLAVTANFGDNVNFMSDSSFFKELDYNNYYRKVPGPILNLGSTLYASTPAGPKYYHPPYKGAMGFNLHSTDVDPFFIGKYDLHLKGSCNEGDTAVAVTADFDGQSRKYYPDMGADEIYGKQHDAGIKAVLTPTFPVAAGLQDIKVVLKNYGNGALTSANVNYTINGTNLQTIAWSGSLSQCDTAIITFTGSKQFNFISGSSFLLRVYTSYPNGLTDSATYNDTLDVLICVSLNGIYTIDPAGIGTGNFTSFTAAINILECAGVTGPVRFNVAAKTYNEQLDLGFIPGASAINTVTFHGNDSLKTIITYSGTAGAPHTFKLDMSKHLRIENLTIVGTGSSYGIGLHFTNGSDSNLVSGCFIRMSTTTTTTDIIGIAVMGTAFSTAGNFASYLTIHQCLVDGGGVSILLNGNYLLFSYGNVIENNTLLNAYWYGIHSTLQRFARLSGNRIELRTSNWATGVSCNDHKGLTVERNFIKSSYQGINLTNFGDSSLRSQVINNIIYNTGSGIFLTNAHSTDFFHNTIYRNATSGTCFHIQSGSGIDIRNNIFYQPPSGYGYCISIPNMNFLKALDHNNYYSNGSMLAITGGSVQYPNLKLFQDAFPSFNKNSVSVAPDFVNTISPDLHLKPTSLSPTGDSSVNVPVDFDNEARCQIFPTIGADESKYNVPAPQAAFTMPDTAWINSPVYFYNATQGVAPEVHSWDIFNDSTIDFVSMNASYIFTGPGVYSIKLITTNCKDTSSLTRTLVIDTPALPPAVNFVVDSNEIGAGGSVFLRDFSLYGPTSWKWSVIPSSGVDFIYSDTVFNPKVVFNLPGIYQVCLLATNNAGAGQHCKTAYIKVRAKTNMCVAPFEAKAEKGIIYDSGGPTGNYSNNDRCGYLINTCADSVKLSFSSFSLQFGDALRVFDGADSLGIPLHPGSGFSGTIQVPTLVALSGKMFIQFAANNSLVAAGFAASWTSVGGYYPAPVTDFTTSTLTPYVGYVNSPMRLASTSTDSNLTFSWDINNDGMEDYNTRNVDLSFSTAGKYDVKLTIENCGGTDLRAHQITILPVNVPPVANFIADRIKTVTGDVVSFTDLSDLGPSAWSWTFIPSTVSYVNGTTSTSRNPQVIFTAMGNYTVKLSATNAKGTDDTIRVAYITVTSYCKPTVSTLNYDIGISKVELKGISNSTTTGQYAYFDYSSNGQYAQLIQGEKATLTISRISNVNLMTRKAWIDFNIDGVFDPAEKVLDEGAATTLSFSSLISVPRTALKGITRMRVATSRHPDPNTACGPNNSGEFEDYGVIISADTIKPVINLTGSDTLSSEQWYHFTDPGYSASDNIDGYMSTLVKVTSNVDSSQTAYYTITYDLADSSGNNAVQRIRVVHITPDKTKPVLTLNGASPVYVEVGSAYIESGYTATDYFNRNLHSLVQVSGFIDTTKTGTYNLIYEVTDAAGNKDSTGRVVIVRDTEKPDITLIGPDSVTHCMGEPFVDPGVTVTDNYQTGLAAIITGSVNISVAGAYTLSYDVTDSSGNIAFQKVRIITVIDCHIGISGEMKEGYLLQIYPNPSDGVFNIVSSEPIQLNEIRVYNSAGIEVSDFRLANSDKKVSQLLDLSRLAAGVYLVQVPQAGGLIQRRITIVK